MAAKTTKVGDKRKASSTEKGRSESRSKKPRVESKRKPFEADDGSDDEENLNDLSEDNEDGGVELNGKSKKPKSKDFSKSKKPDKTSDGKAFERGANSRESHALQKQLAQERKAAKPLADELARTKKLWERLRLKSHVPKDERKTLVDELFSIISGRVRDFVLKHDAVRAVQTALKYSTLSQRKQIAAELKGTYPQLAESKYAKFLIGKLLVPNGKGQHEKEIRDLIVPEFYGKVRKLINHPEASWILDDIYRGAATKEQKAILLREWYGTEFVLFRQGSNIAEIDATADLSQIVEAEPSKRGPILKYLMGMINTLVQKQMTAFTMLHDAMLQYFLCVRTGSDEHQEFMELIKGDESGDLLKNMAFTRSGARLVCLLLAHGGAKDRKQMLKTYKDTFQLMCGDKNAHVVILAAYDLIDDTVLTAKSIFPEILGKDESKEVQNIIFCANDLNARTTVLYLFEGPSKALFPASHLADLEVLKEIHEIRKTTSKKDPETRRKELIAAASPQLLSAVAASPRDLVATSFGCQLVTDVLLSAVGDKAEALSAIAATAAGDPEGEQLSGTRPHISRDPFAGRMLRTLIAGGRFDKVAGKVVPVGPPLNFAGTLYPVIKDHVVAWATGPGAYVPLALVEAEGFPHAEELLGKLRRHRKALEKAAREETAEQRAWREAADGDGSKASGRDGKKVKPLRKGEEATAGATERREKAVGNPGARLLLEKL